MTAQRLVKRYALTELRRQIDDMMATDSEHVTMIGDGLEDFHASDRMRLSLEVGYWGTLDLG